MIITKKNKSENDLFQTQIDTLDTLSSVFNKYLSRNDIYLKSINDIHNYIDSTDNSKILLASLYCINIHQALSNNNFLPLDYQILNNQIWDRIIEKNDKSLVYKIVKIMKKIISTYEAQNDNYFFYWDDYIVFEKFKEYYFSDSFVETKNKAIALYFPSFYNSLSFYGMMLHFSEEDYNKNRVRASVLNNISYDEMFNVDLYSADSLTNNKKNIYFLFSFLQSFIILHDLSMENNISKHYIFCVKSILNGYLNNNITSDFLHEEEVNSSIILDGLLCKSIIIDSTLVYNHLNKMIFQENIDYISIDLDLGDQELTNTFIDISNHESFESDIIELEKKMTSLKNKRETLFTILTKLEEIWPSGPLKQYRHILINSLANSDRQNNNKKNHTLYNNNNYGKKNHRLQIIMNHLIKLEGVSSFIEKYSIFSPIIYTLLLLRPSDIAGLSYNDSSNFKYNFTNILKNHQSNYEYHNIKNLTVSNKSKEIIAFLLSGDLMERLDYLLKNNHKNLLNMPTIEIGEDKLEEQNFSLSSDEETRSKQQLVIENKIQKETELSPENNDNLPTHVIYTSKNEREMNEYISEDKNMMRMLNGIRKKGNIRKLKNNDNFLEKIDTLRNNFPNFIDFINFIEGYAVLNKLGDNIFYIPPSLLVGEPGIGKTFFLSEMSEAIGLKPNIIHMESLTASWMLIGASPQWQAAKTGIVYDTVVNSDYANNIFIFDELDKTIKSNYPPEQALLQFFEGHTAKEFQDEYFPIKLDISKLIWLSTANNISSISKPLLSRLEIFNIKSPNLKERKILAQRIYKLLLSKNSWGKAFDNTLSDAALDVLCHDDNSIREMKKTLMTSITNAARRNDRNIITNDITSINRSSRLNIGF